MSNDLTKKDLLVFVSYTIKDANLFRISEIAETLTNYEEIGDVLYCEEDTRDNFIQYMNKYIGECDVMILFCSPNSLKSEFVQDEWMAARAMKKPIIPVYIKETHIPPLLRARIGFEFDTFDFQKNVQGLYDLILKKIQPIQDLEARKSVQVSSSSTIKNKYDFLVNLGNKYFNSKQYQEALSNYQQARKVSEDLYDINLTIEIDDLITQTENLIKIEQEAKEKREREYYFP